MWKKNNKPLFFFHTLLLFFVLIRSQTTFDCEYCQITDNELKCTDSRQPIKESIITAGECLIKYPTIDKVIMKIRTSDIRLTVDLVSPLSSAVRLHLDDSSFYGIEKGAFTVLNKLRYLSLRRTNIGWLDIRDLVDDLPMLKGIYLAKSTKECSCEWLDLVNYLKKRNINILDDSRELASCTDDQASSCNINDGPLLIHSIKQRNAAEQQNTFQLSTGSTAILMFAAFIMFTAALMMCWCTYYNIKNRDNLPIAFNLGWPTMGGGGGGFFKKSRDFEKECEACKNIDGDILEEKHQSNMEQNKFSQHAFNIGTPLNELQLQQQQQQHQGKEKNEKKLQEAAHDELNQFDMKKQQSVDRIRQAIRDDNNFMMSESFALANKECANNHRLGDEIESKIKHLSGTELCDFREMMATMLPKERKKLEGYLSKLSNRQCICCVRVQLEKFRWNRNEAKNKHKQQQQFMANDSNKLEADNSASQSCLSDQDRYLINNLLKKMNEFESFKPTQDKALPQPPKQQRSPPPPTNNGKSLMGKVEKRDSIKNRSAYRSGLYSDDSRGNVGNNNTIDIINMSTSNNSRTSSYNDSPTFKVPFVRNKNYSNKTMPAKSKNLQMQFKNINQNQLVDHTHTNKNMKTTMNMITSTPTSGGRLTPPPPINCVKSQHTLSGISSLTDTIIMERKAAKSKDPSSFEVLAREKVFNSPPIRPWTQLSSVSEPLLSSKVNSSGVRGNSKRNSFADMMNKF